jgi:hypothetical protein
MMPVNYASNAPVHLCIDSVEYKTKIEVSLKASEGSKRVMIRWNGKIGGKKK